MKRFAGWDYVVLILFNTLRFSPMRETDIHTKLSKMQNFYSWMIKLTIEQGQLQIAIPVAVLE